MMGCLNSGRSDCSMVALTQATLLPGNVTASGGFVTQGYVNSLADTILEALPAREVTELIEKQSASLLEDQQENNNLPLNSTPTTSSTTQTDDSLSPQFTASTQFAQLSPDNSSGTKPEGVTLTTTERLGTRAWANGFGGSVTPFRTGGLHDDYYDVTFDDVYNDFYSTHGGVVVGIDTSVSKDLQIGIFGNYGSINLQQFPGTYTAGGSWNPSGWGGGVMASYWKPNFYLQGLFGATAFTGTNLRHVVIPQVFNTTYAAEKSTLSYVGAIRIGSPQQAGGLIWEPQVTAIWNHNQDDAYTETQGSALRAFGLKVNEYNDHFVQTSLAMRLAWPIKHGSKGLWTPHIKVGWLADWDMNNAAVSYQRAYDRTRFDTVAYIPSNQQNEFGVVLEAGLDFALLQTSTSAIKLYAKGGANVWANKPAEWLTSGGFTFQF